MKVLFTLYILISCIGYSMSTYSENTFIFNMETKRKFDVTNKARAICQNWHDGPCFGDRDLYATHWGAWMTVARSMSSFGNFGRHFSQEKVIAEVYYKVY